MDEKIVLTLMQNVSDKLDDITSTLKEIKQNDLEKNNSEKYEVYFAAVIDELNNSQEKTTAKIIREQKNQIENIKTTIDNTKQYFLFGKDTSMTSKSLLLIMLLLILSSNAIKHIPNYLNKHNQITKERNAYKQVYEFLYLYHLDDKDDYSSTLSDLLKHSKNNKPVFINKLKLLRTKKEKDLKEKELKKQLKALENDN